MSAILLPHATLENYNKDTLLLHIGSWAEMTTFENLNVSHDCAQKDENEGSLICLCDCVDRRCPGLGCRGTADT